MTDKNAVLIVEDDVSSAEFLTEMLSVADYATDTAGTISEAKDALASRRYGAVLLDLTLPDALPNEVVEQLRGVPDKPPIVVFSARVQEEIRAVAEQLGAVEVLQKPASMERILDAIARAVRAR